MCKILDIEIKQEVDEQPEENAPLNKADESMEEDEAMNVSLEQEVDMDTSMSCVKVSQTEESMVEGGVMGAVGRNGQYD